MANKSSAWHQYQENVASFFRSIGYTAVVDARVKGVRSGEDIDVLVTFEQHGLKTTWIIECKHVGRNVEKAEVQILKTLVAELGADRGIILSEKGFQKGAYDAVDMTNITLTSLASLRTMAQGKFIYDRIQGYAHALNRIRFRAEDLLGWATFQQCDPAETDFGFIAQNRDGVNVNLLPVFLNVTRAQRAIDSYMRGKGLLLGSSGTITGQEPRCIIEDGDSAMDKIGSLLQTATSIVSYGERQLQEHNQQQAEAISNQCIVPEV